MPHFDILGLKHLCHFKYGKNGLLTNCVGTLAAPLGILLVKYFISTFTRNCWAVINHIDLWSLGD